MNLNSQKFKLLLIAGLVCVNLGLLPVVSGSVLAQSIPLPEKEYQDTFVVAKGKTAYAKTSNLLYKTADSIRYLLAAVAILMSLTGIVQLVIADDKEESLTKAKRTILYSVIGLAMVALSGDIAKILDLSGGGLLGGKDEILNRTRLFDDTVRVLITFAKYLIGSVGVLMLIYSGSTMIIKSDEEEEVGKAKKHVGYVLGGLFLLVFVDNIIKNVFYKIDSPYDDLSIDLGQGMTEMIGFINFLVSWVGPVAILTLVVGGLMYAASGGKDDAQEKAKKMMIASLIGILLIYGAFAIVSTLITTKL